ncbi:MAG: SAM-dependent methyltransferase [Actinomycetes bacterium]
MALTLDEAISQSCEMMRDTQTFVRAVLSGRRRNMQTHTARIDIRPVKIKEAIMLQIMENDGRQTTTTNVDPLTFDLQALVSSGFANILVEHAAGSMSIRITKKQEPLVHFEKGENKQNLEHDRVKSRLLDSSDPFLKEVGIADNAGHIKPSRQDKYKQVEEFLRLLAPTLESAIEAGHIHQPTQQNPLSIVDLGCGHAYLTFAAHQYLRSAGMPVQVIGIDVRKDSRTRNEAIARELGIEPTIEFRAEEISQTTLTSADVVIALHACDTATDDAIAWGINNGAKLLLIAPCCHHDLQSQMQNSPEPWSLITKHGLMKERFADLLTDSLRAQILKLHGYRTDIVEFVGGEHTPRNLMIRAIKTGAAPEPAERQRYEELIRLWGVEPALMQRVKSPI